MCKSKIGAGRRLPHQRHGEGDSERWWYCSYWSLLVRPEGPKLKTVPFDVSAWWLKNINIAEGTVVAGSEEPALINLIIAERARLSFVFDHIVRIEKFRKHIVYSANTECKRLPSTFDLLLITKERMVNKTRTVISSIVIVAIC